MSKRPPIPTKLQTEIKEEACHRCAICKYPTIEIHHIDSYSKVKEHKFANLIALCPNCHREYHSGKISRESMLNYKKRMQKSITFEANSYVASKEYTKNKPRRLGIKVVALSKEKEVKNIYGSTQKLGVIIKTVRPNTIGSVLQIPEESMIIEINHKKIFILAEYKNSLSLAKKGNRRLLFLINYRGKNSYFAFNI